MKKEALLIIDVQKDYFPGGANELYKAVEAESAVKELIAESREKGRPIIYMQHFNGPKDSFFVPGTAGCDISENIQPAENDKIIQKFSPNSFLNTELDAYLKGLEIEHLIACGMMTHMCVDTTVRAAADLGYDVTLVAAACATKDLSFGERIVKAEDVQAAYLGAIDGVFATVI